MFRNTFTANEKYRVRVSENFSSPIQMQLSFKPKTFSDFFCHFSNLHQIFNILRKNKMVIATLLRKLQAVKGLVGLPSKKHCFRTPFDKQHAKESQTLEKSASEDFHRIFSLLLENLA